MLPERFRSVLHAIATDRKSGAIELALGVVDAFKVLEKERNLPARAELGAAVSFLAKAQPSMVPIHNTAAICMRIVLGGGSAITSLDAVREFLHDSRGEVASNAVMLFPPHSTAITISRSSTVLLALKLAARSGRLGRLYVMESRPRLEGRNTAREIVAEGVECVLVADAVGPTLAGEFDLALVGADAMLKDGAVINKAGTYALSNSCKAGHKPLIVLTESIKLDSRFTSKTWPGSEIRDEGELLPRPPRGLRALNRYFDLTPSANVRAVVHEHGVSRRGWVGAMEKVLQGLYKESA